MYLVYLQVGEFFYGSHPKSSYGVYDFRIKLAKTQPRLLSLFENVRFSNALESNRRAVLIGLRGVGVLAVQLFRCIIRVNLMLESKG